MSQSAQNKEIEPVVQQSGVSFFCFFFWREAEIPDISLRLTLGQSEGGNSSHSSTKYDLGRQHY